MLLQLLQAGRCAQSSPAQSLPLGATPWLRIGLQARAVAMRVRSAGGPCLMSSAVLMGRGVERRGGREAGRPLCCVGFWLWAIKGTSKGTHPAHSP